MGAWELADVAAEAGVEEDVEEDAEEENNLNYWSLFNLY